MIAKGKIKIEDSWDPTFGIFCSASASLFAQLSRRPVVPLCRWTAAPAPSSTPPPLPILSLRGVIISRAVGKSRCWRVSLGPGLLNFELQHLLCVHHLGLLAEFLWEGGNKWPTATGLSETTTQMEVKVPLFWPTICQWQTKLISFQIP